MLTADPYTVPSKAVRASPLDCTDICTRRDLFSLTVLCTASASRSLGNCRDLSIQAVDSAVARFTVHGGVVDWQLSLEEARKGWEKLLEENKSTDFAGN